MTQLTHSIHAVRHRAFITHQVIVIVIVIVITMMIGSRQKFHSQKSIMVHGQRDYITREEKELQPHKHLKCCYKMAKTQCRLKDQICEQGFSIIVEKKRKIRLMIGMFIANLTENRDWLI